jgi:hypothetical protein
VQPDDDALRELMAAPLEPEPRTRRGILLVIGGVGALAVVVLALWLGGDDPAGGDDAVVDGPPVAGSVVSTTTSTVDDDSPTTTAGSMYPEPRAAATLVYDDSAGDFVLFGGWKQFRAAPVLEPWLLDATTAEWAPLEGTFEPSGRELAPAVPVDSIGGIVVVGGTPDQTNSCAAWNRVMSSPVDLWMLDVDAGSWERLEATGEVPDRWGHAVAYDPGEDLVVLFGGVGTDFDRNRSTLLADTWVFDLAASTWEQVDTPVAPSARSCPGMVYDPVHDSILLWGGSTESTAGDTSVWRFDASSRVWTELPPIGETGPEPRWLHRMVTLGGSGEVLMVGGMSWQETDIEGGTTTDIAVSDEVWRLDLSTGRWEQLGPAPAATASHAMATDGERVVAFVFGSTLLYDPSTDSWTDVTPYDDLDWDLFLAPGS